MTPRELNRQRWQAVVTDYVTTCVAMVLFNIVRYEVLSSRGTVAIAGFKAFMLSPTVMAETFMVPLFMLGLYWLSGYYAAPYTGSRLNDLLNAAGNSLIGTMLFFLLAMLNDVLPMRRLNYGLIAAMFALLTMLPAVGRWIRSNARSRRLRTGGAGRRAIILGTGPEALRLSERLSRSRKVMGLEVVAFADDDSEAALMSGRPVIKIDEALRRAAAHKIDAVILMTDGSDGLDLANRFMPTDISVFIQPGRNGIPMLRRSFDNVAGEPLIDIAHPALSAGLQNVKRLIDVMASATALTVLSPLLLAIAVAVKLDSPGSVFYRQKRLGYRRHQFEILKFRSMRNDAERLSGPALSSPDDPRITRVGRVLRKYRLDELPNFWNVLVGEMSLVGPRPEREHFLEAMMQRAPQCALLHRVRPGITSWGMVKYGYAQNVDQMLERLRYDLLYVENMSLKVDIKILFYTIHTVVTGKGI